MRTTITKLQQMKTNREPIVCLTAYDYPTARIVDQADIPVILVGDSLANVVLGYDSTIPVTIADMIHHTRAVVRGASQALIVADMPFLTYHLGPEEALRNAGALIQQGGAHAVKLEGGLAVSAVVERISSAGIPVMGHLGLVPQSVNQLGGYRVQGRTLAQARLLIEEAEVLQEAGAFALVLEAVPADLAALVTTKLTIPTIGIGAGSACDGQIQVIHDLIGLGSRKPKHAKQFSDIGSAIARAISSYADEVRAGAFPAPEHSTDIDQSVLDALSGS